MFHRPGGFKIDVPQGPFTSVGGGVAVGSRPGSIAAQGHITHTTPSGVDISGHVGAQYGGGKPEYVGGIRITKKF